jgi:hypothetical protein
MHGADFMNLQLNVKSGCLVIAAFFALRAMSAVALGEESPDVTIDTPFRPGQRPKTANFYFNGRAVGEGREAFEEILKKIRLLPAGASIVWGPNYKRCGECSGSEPECLPKHLYPDLWFELGKIVKDRQLTVSSDYPLLLKPHRRTAQIAFPAEIVSDNSPDQAQFDATLKWQIGEPSNRVKTSADDEVYGGRSHWFQTNNSGLVGFQRELFLDRIPENSRLLVHVTIRDDQQPADATALAQMAGLIDNGLDHFFSRHVRLGKLKTTVVVPAAILDHLKDRRKDKPNKNQPSPANGLWIQWKNYHGAGTPHDEVLYFANGKLLGRGDSGFDRLLKKIDELPAGATVEIPRYRLAGKMAVERLGSEGLKAMNAELGALVPYGDRQADLGSRTQARKVKVAFWEAFPGSGSGTVASWESHRLAAFVDIGRIIRHDEQPKPPAARLGWVGYDAHETGGKRQLESTAVYTLDGVEVGSGINGFERALKQIGELPEGSTVQVQVCLRTKGPFICPITYEGLRHFERTGFEPYIGMLDLLLEVVEHRKLNIEWLPDEGKSCKDCTLH